MSSFCFIFNSTGLQSKVHVDAENLKRTGPRDSSNKTQVMCITFWTSFLVFLYDGMQVSCCKCYIAVVGVETSFFFSIIVFAVIINFLSYCYIQYKCMNELIFTHVINEHVFKAKERVCIRIEFNSCRISWGHQHGRHSFV